MNLAGHHYSEGEAERRLGEFRVGVSKMEPTKRSRAQFEFLIDFIDALKNERADADEIRNELRVANEDLNDVRDRVRAGLESLGVEDLLNYEDGIEKLIELAKAKNGAEMEVDP